MMAPLQILPLAEVRAGDSISFCGRSPSNVLKIV
jgi:hypothetical protein